MPRYESLQAKTMRKMSPRTLNQLPSHVLMQGKNELAKHIQRTFRTRNKHATYRKGSKMTKFAMRRQLYNEYENTNRTFREFLADFQVMFNIFDNRESEYNKIKYFIDNLERPLLEKLYNFTFVVDDDEEDTTHINNPIYFQQNIAGNKSKKRSKKLSKKR